MNLLQTTRTYKTYANAVAALDKECTRFGTTKERLRYLIAVKDDGRFAPVIVGVEHVAFAVNGNTTVVG